MITLRVRDAELPGDLAIPDGAGHLFEEPGALEEVTMQAADWFNRHL